MTQTMAGTEWVLMLKRFTLRNAGRRTVLEVDADDFGAQREEVDFPLRGIAYDPRDGRVEIMLGELGSVDRHLTHSVEHVTGVDLVTDDYGRDFALRVAYPGGQTVLRLVR